MQNLTGKVTGDSLSAAEWNQLPSEVQNVITDLGITLSSGDLNQLGKAISGYVANGTFYTDSGIADAYVLTQIGSKKAPTAYTDGFRAVFRPGNTNTGASTVNVASLGVVSIKDSTGAALSPGLITAGEIISLYYDSANGWFTLVPMVGFVTPSELAAITSFRNLTGSCDGILATMSFTIGEIIMVNSAGAPIRRSAVSLSINSATTGANGLDTGTIAANTTYYIYSIWNGTIEAGLLSLSSTSPTLPSGYTHSCLIGATITDGSGIPLSMKWVDDRSLYVVNPASNVPTAVVMASNPGGNIATPTWVAVSVTGFVPSIARTIMIGIKFYGNGSATILAPNSSYGGETSTTNPPPMIAGVGVSTTNVANASMFEMVLESSNIYAAGTTQIVCSGWRL